MHDMTHQSIADVAESRLCCSCGACAWVCPKEAVSYFETVGGYLLPTIDSGVCVECGACRSVCPGVGLAPAVADRLPPDPFAGIAIETYVGKTTDPELYANSQSGGVVSALLAYALSSGEIEAAVTTVMVAGNPPRPCVRLAKSVEEVRLAQKSKYCPVPLLTALRKVEQRNGPVALVGLPCQIHGLFNIMDRYPRIRERIRFTVGLICDRVLTYAAIDYLLQKTKLSDAGPTMLHFRDKKCGGYPGNIGIIGPTGHQISLPVAARLRAKEFFTPVRCRLCFDKMNVLADITVGDPWGIDGADETNGESVVVIRTEAGKRLFRGALDESVLSVREIDYQQILVGQHIAAKRVDWRGYVQAWEELSGSVPDFGRQVAQYSVGRQRNGSYRRNLRTGMALDECSSRGALVTAAGRDFLFRRLKRMAGFPLRTVTRAYRGLSNIVIGGSE